MPTRGYLAPYPYGEPDPFIPSEPPYYDVYGEEGVINSEIPYPFTGKEEIPFVSPPSKLILPFKQVGPVRKPLGKSLFYYMWPIRKIEPHLFRPPVLQTKGDLYQFRPKNNLYRLFALLGS